MVLNEFFKSTPLIGKGTDPIMERMDQKLLNSFLSNVFYKSNHNYQKKKNYLNIDRSKHYNWQTPNDVGTKDEIIVSSFTCDAVTFAVKERVQKLSMLI